MPYLARHWVRDSRDRPAAARFVIEPLEERAMLSGAGASVAESQAKVTSVTALYSSLSTAVTGANVVFGATVENASTGAPITSGKISFVVESPHKTVLGAIKVNSLGTAGISTSRLTAIGDYQVDAQYVPTNSNVSASSSIPVTVKVIPVPLNVPTLTTLQSPVTSAESGQSVPLSVTIANAGTGNEINNGLVAPITGSVAFLTTGPNPVVLGEATVKNGHAALSTDLLKNIGSNQITAEYLPANNYYALSTSAPITITINPATVNSPTITSVHAVTSSVETGEPIVLSATVQNPNSSLAEGIVEFATVARHPVVLGSVPISLFGQTVSLTTFALQKVGNYQVQAIYLPNTNRYAGSSSAPATVAVTPLVASSFRVTPVVRHGRVHVPLGFTVTAVNGRNQPVTDYTGTVVFKSPTDSWTIFPKHEYATLGLIEPPAESTLLATFNPSGYTFTTADHGSHTFLDAVSFGKGGAENLKVTQANNSKVFGKAVFSIG
jgi:Bacterial Ig-like domain (group 3)